MKVRYDREGDTLAMLLEDKQIHHAEEHGQIIVNYDENGKAVEIEILNASKLLGEFVTEILKSPKREIVEIEWIQISLYRICVIGWYTFRLVCARVTYISDIKLGGCIFDIYLLAKK